MSTQILMPALSPTMTEGKLSRWLKNVGDDVHAGDVIAEIETDKATMEVEAVDEGKLAQILVDEGTEGVAVNTPIAVIAGNGEDAVHVGVWQIRDWVGSPTNRAPEEHDDIAWVGISELDGLPLVFGALPALLRSPPEPHRLRRRDEAPTTASPSGP